MPIHSTRAGTNRTGMQSSPSLGKQMSENVDAIAPDSGGGQALADTRREYILESQALGLGSISAPATLKGTVKGGAKKAKGNGAQIFIDKLAERLAFERGGTRLYDAVIAKFQAHADELERVTVGDIEHIRNEEADHALMIGECIEKLGADPTAQTPSADLVGVESSGLLQAVSDPRTSLAQTLHAALCAELADHAGWETLIALAQGMGRDDMVGRFQEALKQEAAHLANVNSWYEALTVARSKPSTI